MVPQSKGKMFLAEERGHTESKWFRSYSTFNSGNYYNKHKAPIGALCLLNEHTIAGGKNIAITVEQEYNIIFVPTVGSILYNDSHDNSSVIHAGQAQFFSTPANTSVTIANPYETALVNFLQIWIDTSAEPVAPKPQVCSFDIHVNRNSLVTRFPAANSSTTAQPLFNVALGKFAGREEGMYKLTGPNNRLFVFVIEGAFEVQYRLLNAGDGLALWDVQEIELEALSNDAVILVMEFPLTA